MTVKEFLILSEVASNVTDLLEQIKKLPKPDFISGVRLPDNLNDTTIGQLMGLQSISSDVDCIMIPCHVLLGFSVEQIEVCEVEDVLGFSSWVTKEVERITKLFETTSVAPTPEEKRAGVDQLSLACLGWWTIMQPVWE